MMNCFCESALPAQAVHHCDWLSQPVSEGQNWTTCARASAHGRNTLSNWRLYQKKNHYIFSSRLRADQMPGPPQEVQLTNDFFLDSHHQSILMIPYHLLIALQAACLTFASRHGMGTSLRCAYYSDQETLSRLQVALWDSPRDEDLPYICQRACP